MVVGVKFGLQSPPISILSVAHEISVKQLGNTLKDTFHNLIHECSSVDNIRSGSCNLHSNDHI